MCLLWTEVSEGALPRLIPAIAETDVVVTAFAPLLASMPACRLVAALLLIILRQVCRTCKAFPSSDPPQGIEDRKSTRLNSSH